MKVIPLGKAVREHGVPRGGRIKFKFQLFNPGAILFKDRAVVFLSDPVPERSTPSHFRSVELAAAPKALGGTWERCPALLLEFNESEAPARGSWIGLPREDFPPLEKSELYLCDLMGAAVFDEDGEDIGPVTGAFDVAPTTGGSWNLQCKSKLGRVFEFPLNWIDWKQSTQERLVVPGVKQWI